MKKRLNVDSSQDEEEDDRIIEAHASSVPTIRPITTSPEQEMVKPRDVN